LQIKDLEAEKEVLLASNRSLAEFNLTKEPQLAEGKRHLQELSETGAALCQRIESKVSELSKYAACVNFHWNEIRIRSLPYMFILHI